MERDGTRSLLGHLGWGSDLVDGGSNMEHGHKRPMVRLGATAPDTPAGFGAARPHAGQAEWWFQFGGEVPNLQKCSLRIVSQCVPSSGCEMNWSAFSLVHTKQRSRLLYGKLHNCVSVHYNLKVKRPGGEAMFLFHAR